METGSHSGRSDQHGWPDITMLRHSSGDTGSVIERLVREEVVVIFAMAADVCTNDLTRFPPDELARAKHYLRHPDRQAFLAGRAIVRQVLSGWTQLAPQDVPFGGERFYKPRLDRPGAAPLDVSISHAGNWVACAFSAYREVGLDLEPERPGEARDTDNLARNILTPDELSGFQALPPPERNSVFLEFWRRKEAVLKAAGLGFSGQPKQLGVAGFGPDGSVLWRRQTEHAERIWRIESRTLVKYLDIALALALDPPTADPSAVSEM